MGIRLDQRSYSTVGSVSTWMGDCVWAGKLTKTEVNMPKFHSKSTFTDDSQTVTK